jgi:glutathione S-transferase
MSSYSFVRQFAFVDMDWFSNSQYVEVNRWLQAFLGSSLFSAVMDKYPQWQTGDVEVQF